jgi:hypothetical protein
MADLGQLADQGTPLMASLGQSAVALGQQFANLTPFAAQARTALINLGAAAQKSQPPLVATQPLANRLKALGDAGAPTAGNLDKLTASLDSSGGIEQLMKLLFNGAIAGNGFNSLSHYVRAEPLVSSCTDFVSVPVLECSSNFDGGSASSASASSATPQTSSSNPDRVVAQAVESVSQESAPKQSMRGLLSFLMGTDQ